MTCLMMMMIRLSVLMSVLMSNWPSAYLAAAGAARRHLSHQGTSIAGAMGAAGACVKKGLTLTHTHTLTLTLTFTLTLTLTLILTLGDVAALGGGEEEEPAAARPSARGLGT